LHLELSATRAAYASSSPSSHEHRVRCSETGTATVNRGVTGDWQSGARPDKATIIGTFWMSPSYTPLAAPFSQMPCSRLSDSDTPDSFPRCAAARRNACVDPASLGSPPSRHAFYIWDR